MSATNMKLAELSVQYPKLQSITADDALGPQSCRYNK